MSQPGMISHGMPPRDNDVQRELADLRRRLNQMHGMIVQATNAASAALGEMTPNNWYTSNFAVPTAGVFPISHTITVPAGFTRLSFMAVAEANVHNPTSATDYVYSFITVGSSTSSGLPGQAAAGMQAWTSASLADQLTGLNPGDTVTVQVKLSALGSDWSATSGNGVNLSLLTIWQR